MVLEALTGVKGAENHPKKMIILGILYVVVAVFLSSWIFKNQASMIMVSLTVFACIPLIYNTVKYEEGIDIKSKKNVFQTHKKALSYFVYLFIGFIIAFSALYIVLPKAHVESLFSVQISTINAINSKITGGSLLYTYLLQIVLNNIKVLLFAVLFSFFYGAGAIFILTWNASVIAAAMGNLVKKEVAQVAVAIGSPSIAAYFGAATLSFFRYMTHGLFEIAAYFLAGLAGGIISIAIVKHNLQNERVFIDALDLILISLLLLFVGGIIEVYITPALFPT